MFHSICRALCCTVAATALSGCFFGHLTHHREIAAAKRVPQRPAETRVAAPRVAAAPRVVKPAPAAPAPPPAPAVPAAEALPVRPPPSIEPALVAAAPPPPSQQLSNVIRFGTDAYLPGSGSAALLQAHAAQLKADPRRRLTLRGHGDATGDARYRQALAAKRAETVAKALRGYGVDAAQLEIVAMADDGAGDATRTRRVELIYR